MKEVYITRITEYEFGQRDDGIDVSESLENLKESIKHTHSLGDREGYWRCSEPQRILVDPKVWKKLIKGRKAGDVLHFNELPEGFYAAVK